MSTAGEQVAPQELSKETEASLEERLEQARLELYILYHEFHIVISERHDPYHYQNVNSRSHEIAAKHAECSKLYLQLLGSTAVIN